MPKSQSAQPEKSGFLSFHLTYIRTRWSEIQWLSISLENASEWNYLKVAGSILTTGVEGHVILVDIFGPRVNPIQVRITEKYLQ